MVSTVRYRSFKTFDLRAPRSSRFLILIALLIAGVATHPQLSLALLAYAYLMSGLIGWTIGRFRRRDGSAAPRELQASNADGLPLHLHGDGGSLGPRHPPAGPLNDHDAATVAGCRPAAPIPPWPATGSDSCTVVPIPF